MVIRLKTGCKFYHDGILYHPGDELPETEDSLKLLETGKAERKPDASKLPENKPRKPEGDNTPPPPGNEPPAAESPYDELTVRQMKDLIAERGLSLPKKVNKGALSEVLEAGDKALENDDEGPAGGSS